MIAFAIASPYSSATSAASSDKLSVNGSIVVVRSAENASIARRRERCAIPRGFA